MKRLLFFILIILISFFKISPEEKIDSEFLKNQFSYSFLWDVIFPGYNFYRKAQWGWGSFFLIGRALSLYTAWIYHKQYLSYRSLEKAAKIAEFYYGLGYSYKDPVRGGNKTTKEFSIEAGRSASNRNISIGAHLLLLGIGLYNGYLDNWEEYLQKAPKYKSIFINFHHQSLTLTFTTRLDF